MPPHPLATTWWEGDVADPEGISSALSQVNALVHTAAAMGEHDYDSTELPFQVNVAGTYNVLDAARQRAVKRIVLLSEAPVHLLPAIDDHDGHWRSAADRDHLYDLTKRLQEEIARDFASTFGMNILALRIGHVVDGVARRDLVGRRLESVDYCRGGWVCCHDVARAAAAGLDASIRGFVALPVVGSRSGRERFDVTTTQETLAIELNEWFDDYPEPTS